MSRNWQRVAKNFQKLAAGMYAVKSEASFPYEFTTCWPPTKKSSNSTSAEQRWMSNCASGREACSPAHLKSDRFRRQLPSTLSLVSPPRRLFGHNIAKLPELLR